MGKTLSKKSMRSGYGVASTARSEHRSLLEASIMNEGRFCVNEGRFCVHSARQWRELLSGLLQAGRSRLNPCISHRRSRLGHAFLVQVSHRDAARTESLAAELLRRDPSNPPRGEALHGIVFPALCAGNFVCYIRIFPFEGVRVRNPDKHWPCTLLKRVSGVS